MERTRSLTGYFLVGAGLLHVIYVLLWPFEASKIITLLVGMAYLVLGYLVLRGGSTSVLVAGLVTLIGLLLNTVGMTRMLDGMTVLFELLDIAILVSCAYLLYKLRAFSKPV